MTKNSINSVIIKVNSLIKSGENKRAQELIKPIIHKFPKNIRLKKLLNELKKSENKSAVDIKSPYTYEYINSIYNKGELKKAIKFAKIFLNINPASPQVWNLLGAIYVKERDIESALKAFQKVIELEPMNSAGLNNVAVMLSESGKLSEAIKIYQKSIKINPKSADTYYNMGIVYEQLKDNRNSIESYKKAIQKNSQHIEAYENLGILYKKEKKLQKAIEVYQSAITITPEKASLYCNLGLVFEECGSLNRAIEMLKKAIKLQPNDISFYLNLGGLYFKNENFEKSKENFEKVIKLDKSSEAAWINGAELFEKWNKIDFLEQWLQNASQELDPSTNKLNLYQAKLKFRKKKYEKSIEFLNKIEIDLLENKFQRQYFHLVANCYEKLGEFDKAFYFFKKMNDITKVSSDFNTKDYNDFFVNSFYQNISQNIRNISQINCSKTFCWKPIFLIGFPRSGTTLLDSFLRTHSLIKIIEEKPILTQSENFIYNSNFSERAISDARDIYLQEFQKYVDESVFNYKCIDKLPLNILKIPIILKIFPDAQFLLSIRHPMDCVLSCWMQNFKINAAMSNMLDLDRIVELYCNSMEILFTYTHEIGPNIHTVKYEDFIINHVGELKQVIKFLDLNWEDNICKSREISVLNRKINTPSYSQVSQPIYESSRYKWINYQPHLKKHLKKLNFWIEQHGY